MIWDACDECGHALVAHKVATKECSVCHAVAAITTTPGAGTGSPTGNHNNQDKEQ
jgi:hypothetical protein